MKALSDKIQQDIYEDNSDVEQFCFVDISTKNFVEKK